MINDEDDNDDNDDNDDSDDDEDHDDRLGVRSPVRGNSIRRLMKANRLTFGL